MVDGRKGGTVGFRLPTQPEFLFSEEATVHHRSWSENLTYYTGTGYLSGAPNLQAPENLFITQAQQASCWIPNLWCFWCCRQLCKRYTFIFLQKCFCFTSSKAEQLSKNHALSGAGLLPFAARLPCWGIPRLLGSAAVRTC